MKKLIILLYFLSGMSGLALGQDLILNTINGRLPKVSNLPPNAVAQLIEDRRQQKSFFQDVHLFELSFEKSQNQYREYFSEATFLKLNQEKLAYLWNIQSKDIVLNIPVSSEKKNKLLLTQVDITASGFLVTTSSSKEKIDYPAGRFYQGIVSDDSNSLAAVSIFKDHIRVMIADAGGNYVLCCLPGDLSTYVLYNDNDLKQKNNFTCNVQDHLSNSSSKPALKDKAKPNQKEGDCVDVYVECDFAMYQNFGSNSASVANYVLALFNEVKVIYRNEQINIELSQIFIWTNSDPYLSAPSIEDALELFGQTLQNSYSGRLAHLLSGRNFGTTTGIAWVDVLCDSYYTFTDDFDDDGEDELHHAGPYGVSAGLSGGSPTGVGPVSLVAHELGHNFGSEHTHACVWNGNNSQIDDCGNSSSGGDGVFDNNGDKVKDNGCFNPFADPPQQRIIPSEGGTIMSYCSNINLALGFGPQPGDKIRKRVADADCLEELCSCTEFTDRTITGAPIPSAVYTASNSITSSGDANGPMSIVIFQAGNRIELTQGFEGTELFIAQVIATLCDGNDDNTLQPIDGEELGKNRLDISTKTIQLKVYPNPAFSDIQLEYYLPNAQKISMVIYNQYGQVVQVIEPGAVHQQGQHAISVLLTKFTPGLYYSVLQTQGERLVQSFVVSRL